MFDIQENLKKLPDSPGVYMHKDRMGQIIYVGKAVSLKNRVRQYFQSSRNHDAKTRSMVSNIAEFEYITTGSEMEALILECNLIKKHQPKYNILLRDDKTYPYIKVSMNELFPRITKTRLVEKDGAKYFGPYSDAGAVNSIVDLLNDVYRLKRCSFVKFTAGHRPCLNQYINRCDGVCRKFSEGTEMHRKYMERVGLALDFLKGRDKKLETYLTEKMQAASDVLDYESAAVYRDYILAVRALSDKQRVVLSDSADIDVVMSVGGAKSRYMVIFFVRDGKLSGRETYQMSYDESDTALDMVSAFLKQHYSGDVSVPREIILSELPSDTKMIMDYLSELSGRSVEIHVPMRGEKKALLELVKRDAVEMTKTVDDRVEGKAKRESEIADEIYGILKQTGHACNGKKTLYRVEAYDISDTNGLDTVGAMVVFRGPVPEKNSYRKFKVRTVDGPDDYSSMQEVLVRRLRRLGEDPDEKGGFSEPPDLIMIDGGVGHLNAAKAAMRAVGFDGAVCGMAKDDRHRTKELIFYPAGGDAPVSIDLKERPLLFRYVGVIQEEVHRFAISYHRGLRSRKMTVSVLDEIKGIGPAKRNALLSELGSVDNIRKLCLEDSSGAFEKLMGVQGISKKDADEITVFFRKKGSVK